MWWTHGYRKKTVFRFIDRIVDQKNNSIVKQIFLVLDNIPIHKSKSETTMAIHHPRIQLVFLPTRSPELNLIEVMWICGCSDKQLTIPHLKMNMI